MQMQSWNAVTPTGMSGLLAFDKRGSGHSTLDDSNRESREWHQKRLVYWRTGVSKFLSANTFVCCKMKPTVIGILQPTPIFAGHPVCKIAWMHFLGVGRRRLARCKSTCFGKDGRSTFGRGLPRISVNVWKKRCHRIDFQFQSCACNPSSQDLAANQLRNLPQCERSCCTCTGHRLNPWPKSNLYALGV